MKSASYGLLNANAKWKLLSNQLLLDLELDRVQVFPQLLYLKTGGRIVAHIDKIVDDLQITVKLSVVDKHVNHFNRNFWFGTIEHGRGTMGYFELNIVQNDDGAVETIEDYKTNSIKPFPLSRMGLQQIEDPLNEI